MLIGRRLNDYQNTIVTHFVRWDANTGPLRDYSPVPAPQSLALLSVCCLGIEVDDALEISESIEV